LTLTYLIFHGFWLTWLCLMIVAP